MVTTCCLSPWKVAVCFPESSNTNTSSPCRSELRFCWQESNNNDDDYKDDSEDNDDNDFDHLWVGLQQYNNDDDEKYESDDDHWPPLSWLSRTQQLHEQWAIRVLQCRSALSGDCHEIVWIFMFEMFSGSNCLFLWIYPRNLFTSASLKSFFASAPTVSSSKIFGNLQIEFFFERTQNIKMHPNEISKYLNITCYLGIFPSAAKCQRKASSQCREPIMIMMTKTIEQFEILNRC